MKNEKPPVPGPEQDDAPDIEDQDIEDQDVEDEVDEAGEESFPASDPPPWTTAAAH